MGGLEQSVADCPGSFVSMINNLAVTLPLEEVDPGHACPDIAKPWGCCMSSSQADEDLYDQNATLELESRPESTRNLPPMVKAIVEGNPKVFKSDIDPSNCIYLA